MCSYTVIWELSWKTLVKIFVFWPETTTKHIVIMMRKWRIKRGVCICEAAVGEVLDRKRARKRLINHTVASLTDLFISLERGALLLLPHSIVNYTSQQWYRLGGCIQQWYKCKWYISTPPLPAYLCLMLFAFLGSH